MYTNTQPYTYMPITCYIPPKETMTIHRPSILARSVKKLAYLMGAIGAALIIGSYTPSIVNSASSSLQSSYSNLIIGTPELDVEHVRAAQERAKSTLYQPKIDKSLPYDSKIIISSIGVNTAINEANADNYEEALKKGVWRTPNYGTPYNRDLPLIVAAHRYGYLRWSNAYRKENSFYNLPKLENGDTIEIIWNQRKYIYAVYDIREGEEIEDYSADLIMYTCRDLTSSVRIFVYAKLLEV